MYKKLIEAYYESQYEDPIYKAIENNDAYRHLMKKYIELEDQFIMVMGGKNSETYQQYDNLRCLMHEKD